MKRPAVMPLGHAQDGVLAAGGLVLSQPCDDLRQRTGDRPWAKAEVHQPLQAYGKVRLILEQNCDLSAKQLTALEGRSEGWVAALQLAALSMQSRDNVPEFIEGFAGDDRYIVDYLVEEVLQRQPEYVRKFLLQTSVLNRLTGPLCDAVTGQQGGKAMLEALDRANLFLVALDDRRQWYRYHHLFADVLRAHLASEQPNQVVQLHRRASAWYEQNAERPEAIRHALSARDFGRAADLIQREWPALARAKHEVTLRGWLDALPDELVRRRPVLSNVYAGMLLSSGELEGVDQRLRDAEQWLTPDAVNARTAGMDVANEDEFRTLPALLPCIVQVMHSLAAIWSRA